MRTPEERTSGAWTGGCDLTPDGGNEKTALQATGNTATQRILRGQDRQVLLSLWRTCHRLPDPRSLEGRIQDPEARREVKRDDHTCYE